MDATFECGGYYGSVRNRQHVTVFEGGNQFFSTYDVDKHLKITYKQTQHASFYKKKPGIADVTVSFTGNNLELK